MTHCPKCNGLMPDDAMRCLGCGFESEQKSGTSQPTLPAKTGRIDTESQPITSLFVQETDFVQSANPVVSSSGSAARPGVAAKGEAGKPASKSVSFLTYLPTAIGLGALSFSIYGSYNSYTLVTKGSHAQGTVVAMRDSKMGSGQSTDKKVTYRPVVRFNTSKGESIEFASTFESARPGYSKGMRVEVLYLPTDPDNAEINDFYALWMDPLEKGGAGLVFFIVGWVILVAPYLNSRRARYLRDNGVRIETKFHSVELEKKLGIGVGKNILHPYRILTQWQDPLTLELRLFKSERVWSDPSSYMENNRSIDVFLDKSNPKKYYVDMSFLSLPGSDEAPVSSDR